MRQVGFRSGHRVNGGGRLHGAKAVYLQEVAGQLQIAQVVLDNQDQLTGHRRSGPSDAWRRGAVGHSCPVGVVAAQARGQSEGEGAATAWLAVHPQPAAVQLDELLGERQTQPGAIVASGWITSCLVEL